MTLSGFSLGLFAGTPLTPTQTGATSVPGAYTYSPANGSTYYPPGYGAFVQNSPVVTNEVIDMTSNTLNYTVWKNFAIQRGRYIRPGSGSQFVNDNGQLLYVKNDSNAKNPRVLTTSPVGATALTNLAQLTMIGMVPSDHNVDVNPKLPDGTINPAYVSDQVLFIDTPEGRASGTKRDYALNSSDAFFWKGLLYINGNLNTTGGGAFPDIWGKNPDEYAADPYGTSVGHLLVGTYMDGIMAVTGTATKTGNGVVYGTLVALGQVDGGGSPDIYYNTRNKNGLFQSDPSAQGQTATPSTPQVTFRIVGQATREMDAWPS
jgi:hypothetical protein